jgi:hypothetical protein
MSMLSGHERVGGSKSSDERVLDDHAVQRVNMTRTASCSRAMRTNLRRVNEMSAF